MKLSSFLKSYALVAFLMPLASINAFSHGGGTGDDTGCQIRIGNKYTMHMSGYIPDDRGGREFCDAIPETGRIIIAFDMIQSHLRDHETEIRIVKDLGPDTDIKANTIFHQPYQVHKSGTLFFDSNFEKKGKFFSLVSVRDHDETIVTRFPFTIGYPKTETTASIKVFMIIGFGLFLALAVWWWKNSMKRNSGRPNAA